MKDHRLETAICHTCGWEGDEADVIEDGVVYLCPVCGHDDVHYSHPASDLDD